jgi:hypothetical protein
VHIFDLAAKIDHPFEGGYPYPEKFVGIVGEDTQELDTLPEGHGRVGSLLQYPGIEGEPADVARYRFSLFIGH